MITIILRQEPHPFNPNKKLYRAYKVISASNASGTDLLPLYLGEETIDMLKVRVMDSLKGAFTAEQVEFSERVQ